MSTTGTPVVQFRSGHLLEHLEAFGPVTGPTARMIVQRHLVLMAQRHEALRSKIAPDDFAAVLDALGRSADPIPGAKVERLIEAADRSGRLPDGLTVRGLAFLSHLDELDRCAVEELAMQQPAPVPA